MTDNDKKLHQLTEGVTRIANYMEEILRLVKEDQERTRKYMEKQKDEQASRITNGQDLSWPRALARGPGAKLQATSRKLQAPSFRVDKIKLQCYCIL